jgi:hypothetical protein
MSPLNSNLSGSMAQGSKEMMAGNGGVSRRVTWGRMDDKTVLSQAI